VDGRTYVLNDGHFRPAVMLLGRLRGVDLKKVADEHKFSTSSVNFNSSTVVSLTHQ